jgi:hypothetical protein
LAGVIGNLPCTHYGLQQAGVVLGAGVVAILLLAAPLFYMQLFLEFSFFLLVTVVRTKLSFCFLRLAANCKGYWSITSTVIVDLVGLDDLPMSVVQVVKCIVTAAALHFAGGRSHNHCSESMCIHHAFTCRFSL